MNDIFSRYRKAIITGGGVLIFLIAGLITMIFTDSGNESPPAKFQPSETKSQSQNQPDNPETVPEKTTQPSRILYVYITGEIRKPGVYKLSEDARIFQLVDMAGGFTAKADTESLNLAENLSDGSHVHIAAKLQQARTANQSPTIPGLPANARTKSTVTQSHSRSGKINVNTANQSELESLPGIGPAIAQRIIDYRNTHGNFARPEDLINVRGIGQAKLAQVLPLITAMNTGSRVSQPSSSAGLIDINHANQKELERLPGVGPATAKRIIDYRNNHGRFNSPEDLTNIRGISRAKLDNMRDMIAVR
ncbi:MAG: helix-hairpin-helix domain-containing protein [Synergistaceae bacterium]|nr:helix-hairpin-helix domain-containing protein [Synergistaceae bacterium]